MDVVVAAPSGFVAVTVMAVDANTALVVVPEMTPVEGAIERPAGSVVEVYVMGVGVLAGTLHVILTG